MDIVLRNNLIYITTDFQTLNKQWMQDFLYQHTRSMLFLPQSVLVFRNESLQKTRENFLKELSKHHATMHDFSHEFFLRAMLKYENQPIKIELNKKEQQEIVKVHLYAYDSQTILITLDKPNAWIMYYMRSQLEVYIERGTDISLVLDVSDFKAKARLDRALNKKHILHYKIEYTYDNEFMSKLYAQFKNYSFSDLEKAEEEEKNNRFYTILECPVGASQDMLKKHYKKLSKVYHPDKIMNESPDMVQYYTQKFQQLQEAYTALRA
ncbi:hypothetical protein MNB_SM-3-474 [hydrothermal vent metagenome]|uniref:J domain-containing protein n=1 Tax=hydrothermal vent metagenome TaxID=652676 RepID=A0A1W1D1S1_9ZZZZ